MDTFAVSNSRRTLIREFKRITSKVHQHFRICHLVDGDYYTWQALIYGPPDSPYHREKFPVTIYFRPQYPFKPPNVCFNKRLYHPNISPRGCVSLNILQDYWRPAYDVVYVLEKLWDLLKDPNFEEPHPQSVDTNMYNNYRSHYFARLKKNRFFMYQN